MRAWIWCALLVAVLLGSSACGPTADLSSLEVSEISSGYYDFGIVNGANKLVPSISFRLKNTSDQPISHVNLTVSFWRDGSDGETDSKEVTGIGGDAVPPGGESELVLVRSGWGYTLEQARAELFSHSDFKDFTAKIFAKQAGRIVPIGEFKLEHQIIPSTSTASR